MKCPVCSTYEHSDINLHSDGFDEAISKCSTCGTSWSVNHGLTEVVNDAQANSFLSAGSENVEGYDYCLAA
jgi:uncharacterized Zn finger protein